MQITPGMQYAHTESSSWNTLEMISDNGMLLEIYAIETHPRCRYHDDDESIANNSTRMRLANALG